MKDEEKKFLKTLCLEILDSNAFKNVAVIGVTGSIGRGEKSILDDKKNDVDFFVIAKDFDRVKKEKLEKELRELTNTKFTDILFLKEKKFMKEVKKTFIDQYLFDLLKGNIILYSSEEYSRLFEKLKNRLYKITHRSAVSVLITRLWCLTGPYKIVDDKIVPIEEKFTLYQIKKAFSAVVDATLIHEEMYDSPDSFSKTEKFKQAYFFRMERGVCSELLHLLSNHNNKLKFSEELYEKIVNCYIKSIDYVIGSNLDSYFRFPLKKILILSMLKKDLRVYIKSIIKRYKTLCLVSKFLSTSKKSNSLEISYLFKEIYEEVIK